MGDDQDSFDFDGEYQHKEFSDDTPAPLHTLYQPHDPGEGRVFKATPPHRMVRRSDPPTSHEMAKMVDSQTTKAVVYRVIESFGPEGCIMTQILDAIPEWGYGRITPTFARLEEEGWIFDNGESRRSEKTGRNQRVLVAWKYFKEPTR